MKCGPRSSPSEEDDVEMTGEDSRDVSRVDETLDQLEEWMKEKPIPYMSNDKFSQEGIFQYWAGQLENSMMLSRKKPWTRP